MDVQSRQRPPAPNSCYSVLVRPILEYASELWSGRIPGYLVDQAEKVQMTFLRGTLGLHGNGSGVSDEMVRAEAGCERLQDRWAKLRLGYWRRICISPHRLLRVVAQYRNRERIEAKGSARGSKGWLPSAEITLTTHGMPECWTGTQAVRAVLPAEDDRHDFCCRLQPYQVLGRKPRDVLLLLRRSRSHWSAFPKSTLMTERGSKALV